MRIRVPIAATFLVASLGFLYLGFADVHMVHDKIAHFSAFATLSLLFYWTFDVPAKRAANTTSLVVGFFGGGLSEIAQALLTDRKFDFVDIIANILGCSLGTGLSVFYHQRLLDRRRKARYDRLRQNLSDDVEAQMGQDIELEETPARPDDS